MKCQIQFQIRTISTAKYWYFSYFSTKTCCGYSLEVPCWGAYNEYPQHIFLWKNKKNIKWIWSYGLRGFSGKIEKYIINFSSAELAQRLLSVYVICWIFLQIFQTYFCIKANSVDPDQTAPFSVAPRCLQKWLLKSQADDKADDNSCDI